ncbi:hypothetical protein [Catenovulum sediminis]|uniref:PEP-CTERM protein-sorting domain-containing protein n=1 Tax=Catenovulum sediminis TaxID=1740262 RepID=A0ABV1REN5_9ALTE|nr:hypothetical protein [Catenovulum sediminis]
MLKSFAVPKIIYHILIALVFLAILPAANAQLVFFTDSPASNQQNWLNAAASNNEQVTSITFDEHPLGILDSDFYLPTHGVEIVSNNLVNQTILFGEGPAQGNIGGQLAGEGLHLASNYLQFLSAGQLLFNFYQPTSGFGFNTVDLWTGGDLTIQAFSGANASGNLLGSQTNIGEGLNFQKNNLFFVGLTAESALGSVLIDFSGHGGDIIGFDDFQLAQQVNPVAEPSSLAFFAFALALFAGMRRSGLAIPSKALAPK